MVDIVCVCTVDVFLVYTNYLRIIRGGSESFAFWVVGGSLRGGHFGKC